VLDFSVTAKLKSGVTSTVGAFATLGTSEKTLCSTSSGSQAILSQASGIVNARNLKIQDIRAVGGATWNAFTTDGNIDDGNNDGWNFISILKTIFRLVFRGVFQPVIQ
jgi:hypothetical protein